MPSLSNVQDLWGLLLQGGGLMYPNRTACDILHAMREADKAKNYSYLLGLIEEMQVVADRMEAALWDQKELTKLRETRKKLRKQIKKLEEKLEEKA